jgi:hypothetical protein
MAKMAYQSKAQYEKRKYVNESQYEKLALSVWLWHGGSSGLISNSLVAMA